MSNIDVQTLSDDELDRFLELIDRNPRAQKHQVEALIRAQQINPRFFHALEQINEIHAVIKAGQEHGDSYAGILRQVILLVIEYEIALFGSTEFKLTDVGDGLHVR